MKYIIMCNLEHFSNLLEMPMQSVTARDWDLSPNQRQTEGAENEADMHLMFSFC